MKKLATCLLLIIATLNTFAQLPKGDRIMAWQVDMAQNNNYDSAYSYAQTGCMESLHLTFSWSSMEPNAGNFDANFMSNVLDVANIYYPAYGTKVELQIPTMNTNVKVTPTDLLTTNFDNPILINRFKILLDSLFTHIPNLQLSALNIGNESDIYMGTDAAQYTQYKTFLDAIVPYAKQLYFNLHGTALKVGTTFTHAGLVGSSTTSLCQMVNNGLDIVTVTYYPLNPNFTMQPPAVVSTDFANLVGIYSDTLQPIYFAECGYASSDTCNSSEALQAQFFQNVFSAWDTYYDNIKYLTLFKSTDWSQQEVINLGIFYGINDTIFLEYLRTLGLRTWDNNGTNKLAYNTILCELNARGWCNVNCNTTGIIRNSDPSTIVISPNPTNNVLTITTEDQMKQVTIYNSLGKLCLTTSIKAIDISHLPLGMYYLHIQFESGKTKIEKVIKQ